VTAINVNVAASTSRHRAARAPLRLATINVLISSVGSGAPRTTRRDAILRAQRPGH
jgi:hypothetical protein